MARPARLPILSGIQGWDALVDDNFENIFDSPLPVPEDLTLDETDLATTYPAASYDRCLIWIDHTGIGPTLYFSDGASWLPLGTQGRPLNAFSGATFNALPTMKIVQYTGTGAATVNLPPAANFTGRTLAIRNDGDSNVTVDPDGAETINGSSDLTLAAGDFCSVYSTGTEWLQVG